MNDLKPVCGAKLRGKDRSCQNTAVFPNGRCRLHGGKSLAGIASPTYKSGRFSRVMPTHIADRFNELKDDPNLVSNRDNIALVDTLIENTIEEIYKGYTPEAWDEAAELFNEYMAALSWTPMHDDNPNIREIEPDPDMILGRLGKLLKEGRKQAFAFEILEPMIEAHRKAVDTEYKLVKDSTTRLDAAEAIAIAKGLADSVKRHVKDPETLRLIQADVSRIISSGNTAGA